MYEKYSCRQRKNIRSVQEPQFMPRFKNFVFVSFRAGAHVHSITPGAGMVRVRYCLQRKGRKQVFSVFLFSLRPRVCRLPATCGGPAGRGVGGAGRRGWHDSHLFLALLLHVNPSFLNFKAPSARVSSIADDVDDNNLQCTASTDPSSLDVGRGVFDAA